MSPKPYKRLRALLASAALALLGACSAFTGAAGETPLALEQIDGASYLLTHEKLVASGTGEKDRWRLQRIGPRAGEPVFFDAAYSLDRPEAVGGITAVDGTVAAWVVTRHLGKLYRIERLGLDGSRATWSMTSNMGVPDAYRLVVTQPTDHSFTWLYFAQAEYTAGFDFDRPLLHLDDDGVRVAAENTVWARCDGECRYLVDEAGEFTLRNAVGETLAAWSGEAEFGLRAICGNELVTDFTRYSFEPTAVVARSVPRKFLAGVNRPGHLACADDLDRWLWLDTSMEFGGAGAYAIDATRGTTRKLFTWPDGTRNALAVLTGDARALVVYDAFRDGTLEDSTEPLNCDNDRPLAEPCTADYVFYKTAASTATLR